MNRANPTVVGGFFVGALILAIAAIALFGSGAFFSDRRTYILFFEGSVAGLQIGSPVTFEGVRIGSVTSVRLLLDPARMETQIPVLIELEPDRVATPSGADRGKVIMPQLIEKGLRAQLVSTSFVTGQLAIELDFHPDKPARIVGSDKSMVEIPTIPSRMTELSRKLENLPLTDLIASAVRAFDSVDRLLQRPALTTAIDDLGGTMAEVHSVVRGASPDLIAAAADLKVALGAIAPLAMTVNAEVAPLSQEGQRTIQQIRESVSKVEASLMRTLDEFQKVARSASGQINPMMGEITRAADSTERLLAPQSVLMVELVATLREFRAAANNIKGLADALERNPESVLRGRVGAR